MNIGEIDHLNAHKKVIYNCTNTWSQYTTLVVLHCLKCGQLHKKAILYCDQCNYHYPDPPIKDILNCDLCFMD